VNRVVRALAWECNVQVRVSGSPNERYALLFRDFLRADASVRITWSRLKAELAKTAQDLSEYGAVKDGSSGTRHNPLSSDRSPIRGALTSVATPSPCGFRRTLCVPAKPIRRPCCSRLLLCPERHEWGTDPMPIVARWSPEQAPTCRSPQRSRDRCGQSRLSPSRNSSAFVQGTASTRAPSCIQKGSARLMSEALSADSTTSVIARLPLRG
jgi:hypothetical protein